MSKSRLKLLKKSIFLNSDDPLGVVGPLMGPWDDFEYPWEHIIKPPFLIAK